MAHFLFSPPSGFWTCSENLLELSRTSYNPYKVQFFLRCDEVHSSGWKLVYKCNQSSVVEKNYFIISRDNRMRNLHHMNNVLLKHLWMHEHYGNTINNVLLEHLWMHENCRNAMNMFCQNIYKCKSSTGSLWTHLVMNTMQTLWTCFHVNTCVKWTLRCTIATPAVAII